MKTKLTDKHKGSVLIIALFTITILTMICATSLFVTSQNTEYWSANCSLATVANRRGNGHRRRCPGIEPNRHYQREPVDQLEDR